MSKLSNLCGKLKEEVTLNDGTVIEFKAPKVEDLTELMPLFSGEDNGKMSPEMLAKVTEVLKKMLKRSVPDATDDEIDETVMTNLNTLLNGMTSLLNKVFGTDDDKLKK